ncbi:winged helix-turn-helix domain-containing protein [Streptomyces sp. V4-01]|uniref:Winged helix-turn-helix domain-containing protein n=1 Tax=Actinacidiphila polyblastidii TaxID=3110430 RepID=A0ABU7PHC4_9ACTN|nr:winged helix-turn-helix domain-containing protein [Streptomyces sp. V4-01]
MPLRIHFTSDDLARVTVAPYADMLWELALSLTVLQTPQAPAVFRPWRTTASGALAAPPVRAATRLLTTLVAAQGPFPDFLTPQRGPVRSGGFAAAVDQVRATPRAALRTDLPAVFQHRRPPTWVRELAAGEPRRLAAVADAARAYGEAVVLPHQRAIDAAVQADRSLRARDLLDGGVHRLLGGLPAPLRWKPPVLETAYPTDRDLHLAGRGLTLVPSYFCWGAPVTLIDPDLPPVLVYPAAPECADQGPARGRLAELLGQTRAEALLALRVPQSTSELAGRIGTSVASASRHTGVLRECGLIRSTRQANTVVHVVTRLGQRLLDGETCGGPHGGAGSPAAAGARVTGRSGP